MAKKSIKGTNNSNNDNMLWFKRINGIPDYRLNWSDDVYQQSYSPLKPIYKLNKDNKLYNTGKFRNIVDEINSYEFQSLQQIYNRFVLGESIEHHVINGISDDSIPQYDCTDMNKDKLDLMQENYAEIKKQQREHNIPDIPRFVSKHDKNGKVIDKVINRENEFKYINSQVNAKLRENTEKIKNMLKGKVRSEIPQDNSASKTSDLKVPQKKV